MSEPSLSFVTRLWFSMVCFWRVLLDGRYAWRAYSVREGLPELPASPAPKPAREKRARVKAKESAPLPAREAEPDVTSALVMLGLLQREGRLVHFLEQDILAFDDAEIGAAVRVVHEGCRKALHAHGQVKPVRDEEEESRVVVESGVDTGLVKLTGNVGGSPPYRGVLRHRGWRIVDLTLPTPVAGHDAAIIAPAEVEV